MTKIFFRGIPTDIDVRKLNEAFPNLKEGNEIEHAEIESVIEVKRSQSRYRTVTDAWRKALVNSAGVELAPYGGTGFRVLTAAERVDLHLKGFQSGTRKIVRSTTRAGRVNAKDEASRRKQELMAKVGMAIRNEAQSMMKEIEPPKAPEQNPRVVRFAN